MMRREAILTASMPFLFVLFLLGLSLWLNEVARLPPEEDLPGFSRGPDGILQQAHVQAIGQAPGVRQDLTATRILDFPAEDTQKLEQPVYVRTEADGQGPRIEARSQRGLVLEKGENVYFIGDARITRTVPGDPLPVQMESEYFRVLPRADRVRTEKPVVVRQGKSRQTSARGMEADGKARTVVFMGPVRSVYER